METYDKFLDSVVNPQIKTKLAEIIQWISTHYPELELVMKWHQPMFIHHKTFIVGFSVAKSHLNIAFEAPELNRFKEAIKATGYHQTKMLIQIKENQAIDYSLLKEIIDFTIEDKQYVQTFWR